MSFNKKKVTDALKSVGKSGINLAGRGIIGGAKLMNKGLAKVDAHSAGIRKKGAARRAAEKKAKKAKMKKEGVVAEIFGVPLIKRGK